MIQTLKSMATLDGHIAATQSGSLTGAHAVLYWSRPLDRQDGSSSGNVPAPFDVADFPEAAVLAVRSGARVHLLTFAALRFCLCSTLSTPPIRIET